MTKTQFGSGTILVALLALGLPLSSASSAIAQSTNIGDNKIVGGSSEASSLNLVDVTMIAASKRVDVDVMADQLAGQDAFLIEVANAYSKYPDLYFSSEWTPGELDSTGYKGWVSFAGPVDAATVKAFAALPVPVELRFDAPASEKELVELTSDAMRLVHSQAKYDGLMSEFSSSSGDITIRFDLADSTSAALAGSLAGSLARLLAPLESKASVEIRLEQADDLTVLSEVVRGGSSFGGCTLGFAGSRGNQRGAVTAGHCSNTAAVSSGSSTSMPFVLEHVGSYGDSQFHSTTDTTSNTVLINTSGGTRAITSVAFPSNGSSICNFGKTRSNAQCDTVRNASVSFYNENGVLLNRMAQTNATFTNPGDSGGPWYFNNTALGVHFGKYQGYSTFSRAPDVQAILSVNIKVG